MDYFLGFQESKLKSHLKMAVHRIALQVNKKTAAQKHAKREIATLLAEMKDEKARIKVEHVIREDFTIEALGLLELLCELTHERSKYIASEKTCPPDLKEAIASLIWASNRVDVAELDEVKIQFTLKYGKEFSEESINNAANTVNVRLFQKLSVTPPSAFLVIRYLEEIAREFEVEWISTDLGLPKTTNTQPPSQPPPQKPSQSQTQMGGTSMISHDGRVMGSSSSKVAPMPVGGYDGASSSGAGADMYLPMSSPGRYAIITTLHQPTALSRLCRYTITTTLTPLQLLYNNCDLFSLLSRLNSINIPQTTIIIVPDIVLIHIDSRVFYSYGTRIKFGRSISFRCPILLLPSLSTTHVYSSITQ